MQFASPVVCIVGPTATGKSDIAQRMAQKIDAEVLSADSMQIYKGMDIGTGKVPPDERVVRHFGLDLVDPDQSYSAALYQDYSRNCIRDIQSRGKNAIIAGGTGFYIRAAIDDYDFPHGEQVNNAVRDKYKKLYEEIGSDALWAHLKEKDPESARAIYPNDTKRVVRALELLEKGISYSEQLKKLKDIKQLVPAFFLGLEADPAFLRNKIDMRVDTMREMGLVDEVKRLVANGFEDGLTSKQAIGYKEIIEALHGETSIDEAFDKIKIATHRYAKRQRTWFRKDKRINWIEITDRASDDIFNEAMELIEGSLLYADK